MSSTQSCTILLCTYNGARFLDEQLRSVEEQDLAGQINVIASDDGSSDETLAILRKHQRAWSRGDFVVKAGPGKGFSENFRSVIASSEDDYIAFCDQDDIWHPQKLSVAVERLRSTSSVFSLYGGRSALVDQEGRHLGLSPDFSRPPGFGNALVQSIAAGNTMVLNRAAHDLLRESSRRTDFLMHDWWTYLIVSGAGGTVIFDREPQIRYRQHGGNAIGGRLTLFRRPQRFLELWEGKYRQWNERNIVSLRRCSDLLGPQALKTLKHFEALRSKRGLSALLELRRAKLYRQTSKGDFALAAAAWTGRL